jgi:hypothetical protein
MICRQRFSTTMKPSSGGSWGKVGNRSEPHTVTVTGSPEKLETRSGGTRFFNQQTPVGIARNGEAVGVAGRQGTLLVKQLDELGNVIDETLMAVCSHK